MKKEKKDTGLTGMGTDNEIMAAGLAANMMGHVAAPAQLAVDMYAADHELYRNIDEASKLFGEDARSLQAGSPAFKNYVKKELSEIYTDRAINLGFVLAGGAAAIAAVSIVMGPPGWIMGLLVAMGGSVAATFLKDYIFPSNYNSFVNFASNLQNAGQQGAMTDEAAFVALTMGMADEHSKKQVINSLPRRLHVKDTRDMAKLLESEEGMEALKQAMVENDAAIRASVAGLSSSPQVPITTHFKNLVNNKKLAGVDLLNGEKTHRVGTLIAMHEMQQAAFVQHTAAEEPNPNAHLPRGKNGQISLNS